MYRKWTALGLTLVAATVLAAAQRNSSILVDDFSDGDAEGWLQNDFTGGRGVFEINELGEYKFYTTEPIPVDDPSVGTLDTDWEPSEDVPLFANGTLRARVRANTYGTTVGLLVRENHETETDYGFYGSTSFGTFYIERFELFANPDAPQTILAIADPVEFPFEPGEDYYLEGTVLGSKLSLKAWKVGDPEPEEPILTVQDKVLDANSGSGLAAIAFFDPVPLLEQGLEEVVVSAAVDDIVFTPGTP